MYFSICRRHPAFANLQSSLYVGYGSGGKYRIDSPVHHNVSKEQCCCSLQFNPNPKVYASYPLSCIGAWIWLYIQGQLDLGFGQVKPEPQLSIGQVDFKFFFLPWGGQQVPAAICARIPICVACLCLWASSGCRFSCVFCVPSLPSPFPFFFFFSTDLFSVMGAQWCCHGGACGWGVGREGHWGGLPPWAGVYV